MKPKANETYGWFTTFDPERLNEWTRIMVKEGITYAINVHRPDREGSKIAYTIHTIPEVIEKDRFYDLQKKLGIRKES